MGGGAQAVPREDLEYLRPSKALRNAQISRDGAPERGHRSMVWVIRPFAAVQFTASEGLAPPRR